MSKLLIRPGVPDKTGCVINVTPQSAGWRHVGFQVHLLKPSQLMQGGSGERQFMRDVANALSAVGVR